MEQGSGVLTEPQNQAMVHALRLPYHNNVQFTAAPLLLVMPSACTPYIPSARLFQVHRSQPILHSIWIKFAMCSITQVTPQDENPQPQPQNQADPTFLKCLGQWCSDCTVSAPLQQSTTSLPAWNALGAQNDFIESTVTVIYPL